MQRIMIIGGPGAGKTWLAHQIGLRLDLPVISIDDFVVDGFGALRLDADIDADACQASLAERWIIEGGNSRTYMKRLDRADWLIRLRPSRALRLWRVITRGNITPGLVRWTWRYDQVFGVRDDAVIARACGQIKFSDIRSAGEVRKLLRALPCLSGRGSSPISKAEFRV